MYSIIIIAAVIALDQFVKYQIIEKIMPYARLEIIKDFFYITYVENYGIAFGLFKNNTLTHIISTSIILLIMCCFLFRHHKKNIAVTICLSLIIGGAVGNLIDRIKLGYVVDYIHFIIFPPVFNIADAAIVCGAILLSILLIFDKSITIW